MFNESEWESLKPFKSNKKSEEDLKEKKRYRFQTAYLICEFLCKKTSIKEFTIKSNKIGDEGMCIIAEAFNGYKTSLSHLNISQTSITWVSFGKILKELKNNHVLLSLVADKNNLNTPHTFSAVGNLIKSASAIKNLSLAECHLTDTFGLAFAIAMKYNKHLVKFNLYDNEITSETIKQLATSLDEAVSMNLEEFNLGKNNINDEGGVKLAHAIRNHRSLKRINLNNNALTDETALAFNRNIPINKIIEEVNLAKNLINLRVLEMVNHTCLKIKEGKINAIVPELTKEKDGM